MKTMVKKTETPKIVSVGGFINQGDTPAPVDRKHPGRRNLILRTHEYPKGEYQRHANLFGPDIPEEQVLCNFLGLETTATTSLIRTRLMEFIHGMGVDYELVKLGE